MSFYVPFVTNTNILLVILYRFRYFDGLVMHSHLLLVIKVIAKRRKLPIVRTTSVRTYTNNTKSVDAATTLSICVLFLFLER